MRLIFSPEKDLPADFKQNDCQKVFAAISLGESVSLVGVFGMGTSMFLRFLSRRPKVGKNYLSENYRLVFIDLDDLTEVSSRGVFRLMLKNLYDQIKEIRPLYKEVTESEDPLLIFNNLKKIVSTIGLRLGLTVVIIFDPFQTVAEEVEDTFFANLKSLRELPERSINFLFSLKQEPQLIKRRHKSAAFERLLTWHVIWLSPLNERDADTFISAFGEELDFDYSEQVKKVIISLSGGHPGLLKDACRYVLKSKIKSITNEDKFKEALLSDKAIQTRLGVIFSSFSSSHRELLLLVSRNKPLSKEQKKKLEYLLRSRIVCKDDENLKLFSPLFRTLLSGKEDIVKEGEPLSIHPDTNQVILGSRILETSLTNQEFRLLSFFINHPEKICSRDEIAEAVWGKDAIEGVSDEAIDKLVQRLRGKVEENKAQPRHIITIWGRGYQFLP